MPRTLRNLKIMEVSGVDRGAGEGVKIMLMKRQKPVAFLSEGYDEMSKRRNDALALRAAVDGFAKASDKAAAKVEIQRLAKSLGLTEQLPAEWRDSVVIEFSSLRKALNDPDPEEIEMTEAELKKLLAETASAAAIEAVAKATAPLTAEIAVLKMSPQSRDYFAKLAADKKPAFLAKSVIDQDIESKPAPTADAIELAKLAGLPESVRKQLEEAAQDRVLLKSLQHGAEVKKFEERAVLAGLRKEDGEIMRKAYSGDAAAQLELDKRFTELTKSLKAIEKTGRIFGEFGSQLPGAGDTSAYSQLMVKARELKKLQPVLSEAQAFAKVLTDPANAELAAQERGERMAKISGVPVAA